MSHYRFLVEIVLFSFLGFFEIAPFSVLCKAEYQAARNHPGFIKLKSACFRIYHIRSKSSWFQNKPFWRVLSLGAIKYQPNSKTCPRTRIWSFYGYFKLLRKYSKWNHNDFMSYKIKKRRLRASEKKF